MSDQVTPPNHTRRTAFVIIAVLVVVIVAFVGIGFFTAVNGTPTGAVAATPSATAAATAGSSVVASPSVTPTPGVAVTATPTAPVSVKPTPQATKSASISAPATIKKSFTTSVTKMKAVQGIAEGPGDIAGPAVQFTISITNTTGKSVDLSSTVVNAYYSAASTPANQLQKPGGKAFPSTVANGATVSGVFVFTIPKADRGTVEVTVDTSVSNPVVAFKGSAPTK